MSHKNSVFLDPSGRRATIAKRLTLAVGLVSSALLTVFVVSIAVSTVVRPQKLVGTIATMDKTRIQQRSERVLGTLRNALKLEEAAAPHTVRTANQVVLGFYAPWEEGGLAAFNSEAANLTHVAPVWFRLTDDGADIDTQDFDLDSNPNNLGLMSKARQSGVNIVPVLSNAKEGEFTAGSLIHLFDSPERQDALIKQCVALCDSYGFAGLNIDFEEIPDDRHEAMRALLAKFHEAFVAHKLELSVDVQVDVPSSDMATWAKEVDFIVLMVYDQHEENSESGPIAGIEWSEQMLDKALEEVPEDKLVLGIGNYAYDWVKGSTSAESLTFQDAMAAAAGYRDHEKARSVIQWDNDSFNSYFTYQDDNDKDHTVWLLDAASAYNQWRMANDRKLRGAALWALGTGDPTLWKFFKRDNLWTDFDPLNLEAIHFPFQVSYSGKGEFLNVISKPQDGSRKISIDKETKYVEDEEYEQYASSYLLQKSGYQPKELVLTFDDGPDPTWTPKILSVLKKYGIQATFFCVGANIEANPDIVREAYRDGHEIGNHSFTHPNLGVVGETRARVEILATQRVIESTIGRSTILFRPPYNADSQPETVDEVAPVDIASSMKLVTVGENIDPTDWDPNFALEDGTSRPRTAADIANQVVDEISRRADSSEEGNMILLHDAGGDRSRTVAALDILIPQLEAKGYHFVTCAQIDGLTREQVMPAIPDADRALIRGDQVVFTALHWAQVVLSTAFLIAILLGAGRVVSLVPFALIQDRRLRSRTWVADFCPSVAVLIAAYNEEKTVVATVESVLASKYPLQEVIVVDDGSKDSTLSVLQEAFSKNPLVKIVHQENGGKASALSKAFEVVTAPFALCIDADTQLDPDAISKLIRHFSNDKVGAVAGNVRVGNVQNLLTAWQDVEYRTSQNMDRRAYAFFNAITVVPGAIGMWRVSAVTDAGGFVPDTLAEDMDLTWRLRRKNFITDTDPEAIAWTEAPESWNALVKQRFRWAYGTLQCLVKHRSALGRYGAFGWFALPTLWLFQILFQILGPIVDLQLIWSLFVLGFSVASGGSSEFSASHQFDSLSLMLELYSLFFVLEFVSGLIAYRMDREKPWPLGWLLIQRFAYRQLMYVVMLRSLWQAIVGARTGWGKLARTGSVKSR